MTNSYNPNETIVGAFTRKDAAAYLSISTRLLDKLASEGRLVRTKIGWKSVFLKQDLDEFLKSCRQEVTR